MCVRRMYVCVKGECNLCKENVLCVSAKYMYVNGEWCV